MRSFAPTPDTTSAAAGATPAWLAAAATLMLWAGTPIANRIAVAHMDGLSAGILRSLLAGLLALLIAVSLRLPFPATAGDRGRLVVSGLCSFALWPALMSLGIAHTTAGHAALIMATTPVFTVLIAAAFERRRPRMRWWMGAMVALTGATALTFGHAAPSDLLASNADEAGNLIVMAGVVLCATGYVTGARLAPVIGAPKAG